MRKLLILLLVLLIGSLVVWRLLTITTSKDVFTRKKDPIAVICSPVKIGNIEDVSKFTGALEGRAEVLISPKISGRVNSILVDLGDPVQENQLLATLNDVEILHEVEEANAKLVVARASLEEINTSLSTAQRELERIQTLRQRKVAAETELENAEAELLKIQGRKRVAEALITQQDAALRAAEARLSYTKIYAPIKGFVGKRFVDEGAMLSPTTPIVSLSDMSIVKTVISVVERDYAKIRIGLSAQLNVDAYPDQTFEGRVTRIAPVLDPDTRTAEAEVEFDNSDLMLKPGMFARVTIQFNVHENVRLVSNEAIVRRESKHGVFVVNPDSKTVRFVSIEKGIFNSEVTEVTGVEPDQSVIVMGQHLLSDGDPITINQTSAP